jgi:TatD DNase family protein
VIDTHAHLNSDVFHEDLGEVLSRAAQAGVEKVIDVGIDDRTSAQAVENSRSHPSVFAAIGIHPHEASRTGIRGIPVLEKWFSDPKVVALGEIGLDFHYNFSPRAAQIDVFARQIVLAKERNLPVIVHSRKAMQDVLRVLDECGSNPWRGVFHCFDGTPGEAAEVLARGFHISFTGVVTFKNFSNHETVLLVPLDRLLLETDSPYMTPVPFRGRRNEPCYLRHTAEFLAKAYGVATERLIDITSGNAASLFGLGEG